MGNTALCSGEARKAEGSSSGLLDSLWPAGNEEEATPAGSEERAWNDGDEDEEESAPTAREVSLERMKELHEMFDKVDRDDSGAIERPELVKLLKELYEPSEAEVAEFRRRFDADGNGTLDEDEFAECVRQHHSRYGQPKYAPKIRALFRKHANEDGVIDDLTAVIRELLEVPPAVQRRAMEILDSDGDGSVTFDEFAGSLSRLMDALEQIWQESRMPAEVRMERNPSEVLTRKQKRRLQQLKQQARRRRSAANQAADGNGDMLNKFANGAEIDVQ